MAEIQTCLENCSLDDAACKTKLKCRVRGGRQRRLHPLPLAPVREAGLILPQGCIPRSQPQTHSTAVPQSILRLLISPTSKFQKVSQTQIITLCSSPFRLATPCQGTQPTGTVQPVSPYTRSRDRCTGCRRRNPQTHPSQPLRSSSPYQPPVYCHRWSMV